MYKELTKGKFGLSFGIKWIWNLILEKELTIKSLFSVTCHRSLDSYSLHIVFLFFYIGFIVLSPKKRVFDVKVSYSDDGDGVFIRDYYVTLYGSMSNEDRDKEIVEIISDEFLSWIKEHSDGYHIHRRELCENGEIKVMWAIDRTKECS